MILIWMKFRILACGPSRKSGTQKTIKLKLKKMNSGNQKTAFRKVSGRFINCQKSKKSLF